MQHQVITSGPTLPWNMCVMAGGQTWLANTEGAVRPFAAIAPGSFFDGGKLLDEVAGMFGDRDEGLLIVPTLPGGGDDEDPDPQRWSLAWQWACLEAAAGRTGWQITGDAERIRDTGWATFRHTSGRRIFMGVLPHMDPDRTPLFKIDATAEEIVTALISYAAVTGVFWRMTAGVSGCASIRLDRAERAQERQLALSLHSAETICPDCPHDDEPSVAREPRWLWTRPTDVHLHGAGHMIWSRPLTDAERHGKIVTYDVRAQFLAAMQASRYGWGEPAHKRNNVVFDPERAGFWRVPASPLQALPGPPLIRTPEGRLTWVTTPVMVYLQSHGIEPMVYESWTTATSSQLLKPWAQHIRNAVYSRAPRVRSIETALKRTYAEANGMFNVPGGSIDRTDWHWTTVDTGTVNLRRKLDRAHLVMGMWPCEIYHDAVSYPVADGEEFAALNRALEVQYPVPHNAQPRIGKLKYVKSTSVSDWEARQNRKAARG